MVFQNRGTSIWRTQSMTCRDGCAITVGNIGCSHSYLNHSHGSLILGLNEPPDSSVGCRGLFPQQSSFSSSHVVEKYWTAGFAAFAVIYPGIVGVWEQSIDTVSLMAVSVALSIAIGIPIGIWTALNKRGESALRPLLDAMQTVPATVYLIPVVLILELGKFRQRLQPLFMPSPDHPPHRTWHSASTCIGC